MFHSNPLNSPHLIAKRLVQVQKYRFQPWVHGNTMNIDFKHQTNSGGDVSGVGIIEQTLEGSVSKGFQTMLCYQPGAVKQPPR